MKHSDLQIGKEFFTGTGRWRCTDVGTRIITAINVEDQTNLSWYNGPPYAVNEEVFDECDLEGCYETNEDIISVGQKLSIVRHQGRNDLSKSKC